MINYSSVLKYREKFPDDYCAFAEPSDNVIISNDTLNISVISPANETDDVFLDRLSRSNEAGENLFYKEWEKFEYKEGMKY